MYNLPKVSPEFEAWADESNSYVASKNLIPLIGTPGMIRYANFHRAMVHRKLDCAESRLGLSVLNYAGWWMDYRSVIHIPDFWFFYDANAFDLLNTIYSKNWQHHVDEIELLEIKKNFSDWKDI